MIKKRYIVRLLILLLLWLGVVQITIAQSCWVGKLAEDLAASSNSAAFRNFIKNNENGFASYQIIYKARGASSTLKTDADLLNKIAEMRSDATFLQRIGGDKGLEDIIGANKRAVCKTCTKAEGAAHLQHFNDYLDDVKNFVDNYHNVDGFGSVLGDLKRLNTGGSYNKNMEGAAFMIRTLKKKHSQFAGKITKFEGSIDDLTNGCKYDITFNNGGKATFGEFKSYESGSLSSFLSSGGSTYQQFITYVGKINSMDELVYFFDIGKITDINLIKNRFKSVFEANAQEIFNKNAALFRKFDKLDGTGKIDDWEDLRDLFNHSNFQNSHPILNFIKIE